MNDTPILDRAEELNRLPKGALILLAISLEKDARRYQWLRNHYGADINSLWEMGEGLDAAIDAASNGKTP